MRLAVPIPPIHNLFSGLTRLINRRQPVEKHPVEAYDIWAESYDTQPGNLMLDMDQAVFTELVFDVNIEGKRIADIGCGTGRHWPALLNRQPESITGFDVSAGMLRRLEQKFANAQTYQITDNLFSDVASGSFDVLVSTLTVAHIENIDEALQAWCRILKYNSDIIITDFHPNALAFGGKRTFDHRSQSIAIQNFVHYVYDIEGILMKNGFHLVKKSERTIDEDVKHYYTAKNALPVYERFKGSRIIYGIHLKRGYAVS